MERNRSFQIFHILILLTTVFGIISVGLFVLMFCAKSMTVSTQLLKQRIEIRSTMGLEKAEEDLRSVLNAYAKKSAQETYVQTQEELMRPNAPSLSEEEAGRLYRLRYCERLKDICSAQSLAKELNGTNPEKNTECYLDTETEPSFEICFDSDQEMIGCELRDVVIVCRYAGDYEKKATLTFTFSLPDAVFYNGNDSLFDFSLIGCKGIYFTGNTTSVVGNLYAGTHSAEEYRKAEAGYGERGIYGGINLMATQLGIEADRIISTGDINLKGSFAAFGTDEKPIEIYAGEINEIAGYFMPANYTLFGEFRPRNGEVYTQAVDLIEEAGGSLLNINYYYDSENDDSYRGKYRKILSGTDVTIDSDFTGVIMTAGNVIIESDCNVEGLIYAMDRIYVQGNNNIVSNRDIMRRIIDEESSRSDADTAFLLRDYMGGIIERGYIPCPEEMVAYVITK